MTSMLRKFPWILLVLLFAIAYPLIPNLDKRFGEAVGTQVGLVFPTLFIFGILGLALNVVLGYSGQLHLGIAAFFGIGAFVAGVLRISNYPFQFGFWTTLLCSTLFAMALGVLLSAPVLRLRGDYLAIVTLGFGMITITLLRKFEEITGGKKTLSPIPPPELPGFVGNILDPFNIPLDWTDYRLFYFVTLAFLAAVYFLLWNLERSRMGRAWVAIREDELAAGCMGINVARAKLAAFALGAGLAGLAGGLYAVRRTTTLEPTFYDFQLSVTVLCAVILGGLANRNGVLLGVFFISGFEYLFSDIVDGYLQRSGLNPEGQNRFLSFSTWKLMIFGWALILVMRFRPHGLIPAVRENRTPLPRSGGSNT